MMKTKFYPVAIKYLTALLILLASLADVKVNAQATYAVPVSIGNVPCSTATARGFMQFNYVSSGLNLTTIPPTSCNLSGLESPGFSEYNSSISYNPADQHLYFTRYLAPHTYVWRWMPGSICPPETPLLVVYPNTYVVGLTFDTDGMGYQLIYTGSYPYGLAIQQVDFSTSTLGPVVPVSLPSGLNPLQGNGDFVVMPNGQFMAILDNNYITINYKDYGTATPLQATLISIIPGNTIIGLSYSDGKLVASDYYVSTSNPPSTGAKYRSRYYEISIVDGVRVPITTYPCYFSTDMTDINTAIGAAKKLISATPTGTAGVYDLCYDIYVQNYGNWPLRQVGLIEDLTLLNGSTNVSNVTATLIDNPAGVVLNPSYNGRTNTQVLNVTASNLPASPTANNHFTVRVCFRLSGVEIGRIYNNNVSVTGIGYLNQRVTDVSTDGTNPDLNSNAKPDDPGEDQPTPFVILTTAEMPPCDALNRVLYLQNFGTGGSTTALFTGLPAATGSAGTATTGYTGSTTTPLATDNYALTRNARNGNTSRWNSLTDHTNGSGRMMVVNADVQQRVIYRDRVNIPCGSLKYSLFAFVSNISNSTYQNFCQDAFGNFVYPKLLFTIRNPVNGHIITNLTTPDITSASWTQFGMKFVMPPGISQVEIEISNAAPGGCGNDIAIDDVQFGLCDPTPTVIASPSTGCVGGIATFSAQLTDTTVISGPLEYQWQTSTNGTTWTNVSGANNVTYTINPLLASQVGRYFRVMVAAAGDITNSSCRYTSNSFQVTAKNPSVAATNITASPGVTTCPGNPITLTRVGGTLGTNAVWRWYRNSCGDTLIGTGNSIIVSPMVTTTYYLRAEGDCNNTTCQQITITVNNCSVLPIKFHQFTAEQNTDGIHLNWRLTTTEQLSHFEIERSYNGKDFSVSGQLSQQVSANTTSGFNFVDAEANLNNAAVYYRVKAVGNEGGNQYSNIAVVRLTKLSGEKMRITPNPASTEVNVFFYSSVRKLVEYQLMDMTGKIVFKKSVRAEAGQNIININDLGKLSEGVYTFMLLNDDQREYDRIIIKR